MPVRQRDYAFLVVFAAATFFSIVFMTVLLPNLVFQPEPSVFVMDLDEQQLRGRNIYKREGCWYCHTQFVRPQDRSLGPVALAGDFEFSEATRALAKQEGVELVHLLGTERTGPDLSMIGGKYPDAWHKAHHRHPTAFNPGTLMPSFDYLSEEEMTDLVAYLQTLGRLKNDKSRELHATYKGNFNAAYENFDEDPAVSLGYLIEPEVPWEFKHFYAEEYKNQNPVKWENRYIAGARGIYNNKCAHCHGVQGDGQGPRALALTERPANFQSNDPNMGYDEWSDIKWFWKISEGAGPGAVMPRWNGVLHPEQIWYLVQYVKYLAQDRTMPDAPRWEPNLLTGTTFHFEGDDLVVYPYPPDIPPELIGGQAPVPEAELPPPVLDPVTGQPFDSNGALVLDGDLIDTEQLPAPEPPNA